MPAIRREAVFRPIEHRDLAKVLDLWAGAEGLTLRAVDSAEALGRFLDRNPGLSWSAWSGAELVGAVLCGHDGRRGYIHHLAVHPSHRNRGIGRELAERVLDGLAQLEILKCHLFVRRDNEGARDFWEHAGWRLRQDIWIFSTARNGDPDA